MTCPHCVGYGYVEVECGCDWPTCRVCRGSGVLNARKAPAASELGGQLDETAGAGSVWR